MAVFICVFGFFGLFVLFFVVYFRSNDTLTIPFVVFVMFMTMFICFFLWLMVPWFVVLSI